MVFGLFASVANDLTFLSVHVRLLIYLLRSTYLSWPVYCIFSRFRSCSFGTVRHGCERTVFGSDLDGVRPFRIRCQRPHVFVCAGSVAYIPATVQLPVLTCVLCILTVSKLQFRHRAARLRTHGFRLGFRWCSAFSHPLPTTSCFCLYTFGCSYTCYGPLTCLDLCTVYFHGFEAAVSAPCGTVANARFLARI